MPTPPLEALGRRIVLMGPSNSGKSTLAHAMSVKTGLPIVHLDQLRFVAGTDWVMRPDAEFAAEHEAAIAGEEWIMEGNYSTLLPQRLARATGVTLLWSGRGINLYRYLRRCLLETDRIGSLACDRDSIKWEMVRWILLRQPVERRKYEAALKASGLPMVEADDLREIDALYDAWGLETPMAHRRRGRLSASRSTPARSGSRRR